MLRHNVCVLGVAKMVSNQGARISLSLRRPQSGENQCGYMSLAFAGPQNWEQSMCLHKPKPTHDLEKGHQPKLPNHLCRPRVPKKRDKSELVTSPVPSRGPTSEWNCLTSVF